MSDTVAVSTFRELAHHSGRVRKAMAVLTLRHHFVFFLVAGHTEKRFVLGFAGSQQVECFTVTGCALL